MALNPNDIPDLAIPSESNPADVTFYFKMQLNVGLATGQQAAAPMTAVYVPDRNKLQSPFDVILYFHGHKKTSGISIQRYLKDSDFALRQFILASQKRDVLLIAPTLGDKSASGDLQSASSISAFLLQVLNGLYKHLYGSQGKRPTIGQIILAAHSGGGSPMKVFAEKSKDAKIFNVKEGAESNVGAFIKEVWCIDSTYGNGQFWLNWASAAGRTTQRLWVFSTGSWDVLKDPTKPKSKDNPVVSRSGTGDDARIILNGAKTRSNIEVLIKPVPPDTNRTPNFNYGVAAGHNQSVGFYFSKLINSSDVISS